MKDLYVKRSTVLTAIREWWENALDTRNLFEVLQNVSDDIIIAKPWNKVTDKLPVVSGSYMVTVLQDGVASTHEAFSNAEVFTILLKNGRDIQASLHGPACPNHINWRADYGTV